MTGDEKIIQDVMVKWHQAKQTRAIELRQERDEKRRLRVESELLCDEIAAYGIEPNTSLYWRVFAALAVSRRVEQDPLTSNPLYQWPVD